MSSTHTFKVDGISFQFSTRISKKKTLERIEEDKEKHRKNFAKVVVNPLISFAENLSIDKNFTPEDKKFLIDMMETIRVLQSGYEVITIQKTCAEKLPY